jgi:hypothetical protein
MADGGAVRTEAAMENAPDQLQLNVDGETFDIRYDLSQSGAYHFHWVSGPNQSYGFTSRISTHERMTHDQLVERARGFLQLVDPRTGFIED